jgi:hypothetical protein
MLSGLWDYWRVQGAGRSAPLAEEIDLGALGPDADRVLIVQRDNGRFRYTVVGSTIQKIYGYPMEGLYLDVALPPNRRREAIGRYATVCDSGRPALARNSYQVSKSLSFLVERLILPLARPDNTIGGVISGQVMRTATDGALGPQTEAAPANDELIFLDGSEAGLTHTLCG